MMPAAAGPESANSNDAPEANADCGPLSESTNDTPIPNDHDAGGSRSPSVLSAALEYIADGFAVAPVKRATKEPAAGKGWNGLRITRESTVAYFNDDTDIGFLCGEPSAWHVDIDIDAADALALADRFLPITGLTFGRKSKPAAHRLYIAENAKSQRFIDPDTGCMIVEIRSSGVMTVLPPSTHPSGEPIEWARNGRPREISPEELRANVGEFAAAYLVLIHCGSDALEDPPALWPATLDKIDRRLGDTVRKFLDFATRPEANPAAGGARASGQTNRKRAYCLKAFADEAADVAATLPGNQSNRLNEAARKLGELIQPSGLSADEVITSLIAAAEKWTNDPEREPWTREQIRAAIDSGIRAGMEHPRDLSEFEGGSAEGAAAGGWVSAGPYRLLTLTDLRNLPPVRWLIEGMIAVESLAVLYGEPGIGKTFLALAWALSVASGRRWLGRAVEQSEVVYISFVGVSAFSARIDAWQRQGGVSEDELSNIFFIAEAEQFRDARQKTRLRATFAARPRPRLIVIDTYARAFAGEENSAKDTGDFIAFMDELRILTGATILLVHHSGKDIDRGERGSTALRGAVDTVMLFQNTKLSLLLSCKKQRVAEPFPDLTLALDTIELDAGDSSCVVVRHAVAMPLGKSELKTLRALHEAGSEGATSTDWQRLAGFPQPTFQRHRSTLVERGYATGPREPKRGERYTVTEQGREALSDHAS
jgi:hypothetical protein